MDLNRVKQFYLGLISKITDLDKMFIRKYLNKNELNLFSKLAVYDQSHCIRTAREIERFFYDKNIKNENLIKVALLHDIGKIECKLTLLDKSLLVLLDKFTKGKIKKFTKIKKIDIYYNHGQKGYDILKKYNYDERFLYLIKNHHSNDIIGDKELDILKLFDDKN